MNNGKEIERAELHKTIWRIANDLRGSVDGWDFKSYVLGMLFYRFISENLTSYLNDQERKTGNPEFDYARLSDSDAELGRDETVKEKGFYILPSQLFVNIRARARHDADLNETLSRVFADIEGSAIGADSEDDVKNANAYSNFSKAASRERLGNSSEIYSEVAHFRVEFRVRPDSMRLDPAAQVSHWGQASEWRVATPESTGRNRKFPRRAATRLPRLPGRRRCFLQPPVSH